MDAAAGRCGLAIDGRMVLLSEAPGTQPGSVTLMVLGHLSRTDVQVLLLGLWSGVKGGGELASDCAERFAKRAGEAGLLGVLPCADS